MINRMRFFRMEVYISQHDLARATLIPRWKIQLIETGIKEPTKEEKKAIARVLGAKEEAIFPKESAKNTQE